MKYLLLLPLLLALTWPVSAASSCSSIAECISTQEWRVALAFGYGERSNPLRGGSTQDLLLIGDFAWYGEAFYFDNLEAGYQWHLSEDIAIDSYIIYDREARPFNFFDGFDASPLDIFEASQLVQSPGGITTRVSVQSIGERHSAVHGGVRFHYGDRSSEWQLSLEHDISNTHDGMKARLAYRFSTSVFDWLLSVSPQLFWHDADFNDYYYGISARDTADTRLWYHASSGFRTSLNISLSRQLSEHWGILLFSRYQRLPATITDSPLVDHNSIHTVFAGLTYVF